MNVQEEEEEVEEEEEEGEGSRRSSFTEIDARPRSVDFFLKCLKATLVCPGTGHLLMLFICCCGRRRCAVLDCSVEASFVVSLVIHIHSFVCLAIVCVSVDYLVGRSAYLTVEFIQSFADAAVS